MGWGGEVGINRPTFICVDGLQVHHMSDDVVLIADPIASQHVPR